MFASNEEAFEVTDVEVISGDVFEDDIPVAESSSRRRCCRRSKKSNTKEFRYVLRFLNIMACILHTASAVAIFLFADYTKQQYTIFTAYPEFDPTLVSGTDYLNTKELFPMSVGLLCTIMLFVSALNHFIACTMGTYKRQIASGYSYLRWIEYSVSVSLIKVTTGMLCGVRDAQMLLPIFGLSVITMMLGLTFELRNSVAINYQRMKLNWSEYWLMNVTLVFSWITILTYFVVNFRNFSRDYLKILIPLVFVLDLGMSVVLGLTWKFRDSVNYACGDIGFIVLSLLSKNLLAWITFYAE